MRYLICAWVRDDVGIDTILRTESKMGQCTAIVLAAGAGKRMQSNVAKQYMLLNEKPVIWYALHAFEESSIINKVILVVGAGEIPYGQKEIVEKYGFTKVKAVIEGGSERYLSVWEGLKQISSLEVQDVIDAEGGKLRDYVFIHDGARPFVTEEIIRDTYEAAKMHSACVAGMPVKDTIKIADEDGFAIQTPNRKTVWAVQTPQVFEKELIVSAYASGSLLNFLVILDGCSFLPRCAMLYPISNSATRLAFRIDCFISYSAKNCPKSSRYS